MRVKLTQPGVDRAKAGDKELLMWDTLVAGFGCRVRPTGRKFFVVKYRVNKQIRWTTLGEFGKVSVTKARAEARKILGMVERGLDPAAPDDEDQTKTVARLCQAYIAAAHLKPKAQKDYQAYVRNHIAPKLGALPLDKVQHDDIDM